MKRIHRTMLTAGLVLAIGGVAAGVALKQKKPPEVVYREAQEKKRLFKGFGLSHIKSGTLMARTATLSFERDKRYTWKLTDPVDWPADAEAIDSAINQMVGVLIEDELQKSDFEKVALDKPTVRLTLKTAKGETHQLIVGPRNELSDRYPITDGKRTKMGLANAAFYWAVDRPVVDFRSKRPFPLAPNQVTYTKVIERGTPRFVFEKKEGAWHVSLDGKDPKLGDPGSINLVIVAITKRLLLERFVADDYTGSDEQKKKYGLDKPRYTLELHAGEEKRIADVGEYRETSAEEPALVLNIRGTPTIAEIPSWLSKDLDKSLEQLRDRTIARFDKKKVNAVHIFQGPNTIKLKRSDDGADWLITAPKKHFAKPWKIDDIVRIFSRLKASKVHKRGASKEELKTWLLKPYSRRLRFFDKSGEALADVSIGNYATDEELFIKATASDRVDLILAKRLVSLPEKWEELIDKERAAQPN